MNFLSGRGAEELTVYSWNTKVSAPLAIDTSYDFYIRIMKKDKFKQN